MFSERLSNHSKDEISFLILNKQQSVINSSIKKNTHHLKIVKIQIKTQT